MGGCRNGSGGGRQGGVRCRNRRLCRVSVDGRNAYVVQLGTKGNTSCRAARSGQGNEVGGHLHSSEIFSMWLPYFSW